MKNKRNERREELIFNSIIAAVAIICFLGLFGIICYKTGTGGEENIKLILFVIGAVWMLMLATHSINSFLKVFNQISQPRELQRGRSYRIISTERYRETVHVIVENVTIHGFRYLLTEIAIEDLPEGGIPKNSKRLVITKSGMKKFEQ